MIATSDDSESVDNFERPRFERSNFAVLERADRAADDFQSTEGIPCKTDVNASTLRQRLR
jgi:hypothetical protein